MCFTTLSLYPSRRIFPSPAFNTWNGWSCSKLPDQPYWRVQFWVLFPQLSRVCNCLRSLILVEYSGSLSPSWSGEAERDFLNFRKKRPELQKFTPIPTSFYHLSADGEVIRDLLAGTLLKPEFPI
jgi:hypothetical protein